MLYLYIVYDMITVETILYRFNIKHGEFIVNVADRFYLFTI